MRQREIDHAASVAQAAELEVITVQIIFISTASKKIFSPNWELSYRVFYPPQCATNSDAVHSQLQSFEFHLFCILSVIPLQLFKAVRAAFSDGRPISLPFPLISKWTNGFSLEREIGKGAFGSVYSGIILCPGEVGGTPGQGMKVAVKKVNGEGIMASLLVTNGDGEVPNNFLEAIQREINVLSSFRHTNIICLVGYCLPPAQELRACGQRMKELCLVYELAPLGGLNGLLKDDHKASMMLWQYRLKIAIGVAKGLCCMHYNTPGRPAYHRDMKAANIAIMDDYTAKIIDCGLSKYVPETSLEGLSMHSSASSRHGTVGYMCPWYCKRNMPYDSRCEVYSFGIVLLELITGCFHVSMVCWSARSIVVHATQALRNSNSYLQTILPQHHRGLTIVLEKTVQTSERGEFVHKAELFHPLPRYPQLLYGRQAICDETDYICMSE